jgi:hypothetical protein
MSAMRRRIEIALTIVAVLVAVATIGWLFGPSGDAHGVEFSPDLFCHRSFHYRTWCGIKLPPTQTHVWRSKVDEYVHNNGFATSANVDNPRWDFVKGFAPGVKGWTGKAKHMCQALGCWEDSDKWVVWSENNPELAKVVWPQVVEWASDQKYYAISTFFGFTGLETASTPDDVRKKIAFADNPANW